MKKIDFLTFGQWSSGPGSLVPDGGASVRQTIELAVAAEEVGFDGAWVRVHHFSDSLSAPFPLLAAMAARTKRIDVGTGVVDLRYENPLYMAEEAATTDQVSGGRLQLGISRGSPEPAEDGQRAFGYELPEGHTWDRLARERAEVFRRAIGGGAIAHSDPLMTGGVRRGLPVTPQSPGLENRIWWGAGSHQSGIYAGQAGMNLVSSTLLLQDDGRAFHVQQADQVRAYRAAYAESGRTTGGMAAVTRSAFPITSAADARRFGVRRERGDSVGHLDGAPARSGPNFSGAVDDVAEQMSGDEAMREADCVLFTLPSQLGIDYNRELMANIVSVAVELGWKESVNAAGTRD